MPGTAPRRRQQGAKGLSAAEDLLTGAEVTDDLLKQVGDAAVDEAEALEGVDGDV